MNSLCLFLGLMILGQTETPPAAKPSSPVRERDLIYGRKFGMALTMDRFAPIGPSNGKAVLFAVSGGWFSSSDSINGLAPAFSRFCKRGYTVLAVVHGSQPRFTIPEAIDDMHLATRYIRHRAKDWNIDPDKLAISGGSAGGHLSLMMGVSHKPGDPKASDPVLRKPSGVQAVACFYPPTDFLNWGEAGRKQLGRGSTAIPGITAPFRFVEYRPGPRDYQEVTKPEQLEKIGMEISPVSHIGPDTAPTMIIHGDADLLVPIQQAIVFEEAMKKANRPMKLIRRPGAAHGWPKLDEDIELFADWFDEQLGKPK